MGFFETLASLIAVLCAVWVIYDVWSNQKHMKQETKIIWTVCAVIFNIITALICSFVVKK